MSKNILITGKNGYLGTSFKQYIEQKNSSLPSKDRWNLTFVSVKDDAWREQSFAECDVILHAAGIVHRKEEPGMEQLYYEVNTNLTRELAEKYKEERLAAGKAAQFVFLSTMSVYGKVTGQITGQTVPAPVNFYGKSKLDAEKALQEMQNEAFTVSIVRPPMIYGRTCTGNYRLLEKLARKLPVFPKTKNERSMLYIENLCEFLRLLMEKEAAGVFCPQNREYVNTSEMVAAIRKSYGKAGATIPGFGWLLQFLAGKITLFSKVFGSLTYERSMSEYPMLGDYQIVNFGESINGSKE